MDCPKCGAAQEDGREECVACGIIFARWLDRQQFPPVAPPNPVETVHTGPSISRPALIAGVIAFVLFGVIWTAWRRSAREKPPAADILDQINQDEVRQRQHPGEEAGQPLPGQTTAPSTFPSDLGEPAVRDLIERCAYFEQKVTIEIPKTFERSQYASMADRYPALAASAKEHLIEFEPAIDTDSASPARSALAKPTDTITVRLTAPAYSKVDIVDRGDSYEFGIGRRRIDSITTARWPSVSEGSVGFHWSYEKKTVNDLAGDRRDRSCGASMQRTTAGWAIAQVWINHGNNRLVIYP
jgi:hypothetical protein